jgi:hypothetical protein
MNDTSLIRGLTICQRWASLIGFHGKNVENRTWSTGWTGTLLIHAAKTADPYVSYSTDDMVWGSVRGAVIAVARLEDCHEDDGPCTPWAEHDAFHWLLAGIRPLNQPVACTGRLGLWTPAPDVLAAVGAQLGTAL